jgi:hypothetical protein
MYDANRSDTGVVEKNWFHDNIVVQTKDDGHKGLGFEDYTGGSLIPNLNQHGNANGFWYPASEAGFNRYSWDGTYTPSLNQFNATPGGGVTSYYLTDAQRDAALNSAGIPH